MTTASISLPRPTTSSSISWAAILDECIRQLARLHASNTPALFR